MYAWVRFINKTNKEYICICSDEISNKLTVYKGIPSEYCYFPAGCVNINIYDTENNTLFSERVWLYPSLLQTVTVSNLSFSDCIVFFSMRDI